MKSINRILTEAVARKAVKEIMDSPERSSRNLVDLALNFAEGQYLRDFLLKVQEVLRDENSPYYRMIIDAFNHIDTERLITFGMNIGFNSVTVGSPKIRKIEQEENFDIPWSVYLDMHAFDGRKDYDNYNKLIKEGAELGIFSWIVNALDKAIDLLELCSYHDDSAFILFVNAAEINEELIEKAHNVNNVMFAVKNSEEADRACLLLRNNSMLYSVYYSYSDEDEEFITSGEYISAVQTLRPVFTIFAPDDKCSDEVKERVYKYIKESRMSQKYITVPIEAVSDTRYIDGKISDDECSAGIDPEGFIFRYPGDHTGCNVFETGLHDALKATLPKNRNDKSNI